MDIIHAIILLSNFIIIPAITYGAQLALGALGITLIYAVLRFAHFAHGDMMAFGGAIAVLITWLLQYAGISLGVLPTALLALPMAILATILLALFVDKLVFSYYRQKKSAPVIMVMASIGVMFIYHGVTRFIIGVDDHNFNDGARFIISAREFKKSTGFAEGLSIKTTQVITVITSIILITALFYFLKNHKMGKAMRAFADNEDLALLSGINPKKTVQYCWVIAASLAAIAGTLYGLDKSYKPLIYFHLLLPMFAAAIVGGMGQPIGAIAGGLLIAFCEITLTYAYKKFFAYFLPYDILPSGIMQFIATEYKFAISFLILVIVLLIRPTGIFKGRVI